MPYPKPPRFATRVDKATHFYAWGSYFHAMEQYAADRPMIQPSAAEVKQAQRQMTPKQFRAWQHARVSQNNVMDEAPPEVFDTHFSVKLRRMMGLPDRESRAERRSRTRERARLGLDPLLQDLPRHGDHRHPDKRLPGNRAQRRLAEQAREHARRAA